MSRLRCFWDAGVGSQGSRQEGSAATRWPQLGGPRGRAPQLSGGAQVLGPGCQQPRGESQPPWGRVGKAEGNQHFRG